jgi:toxin FitB
VSRFFARGRPVLTYLLDDNVVSELRKIGDGKADANVVAWVDREDAASLFLSATTILELERGILGVQRREAAKAPCCGPGSTAKSGLNLQAGFYRSTMPSRRAAPICMFPIGANEVDALIAATALIHGLAVVTRNVRDFEGIGAIIVDPWLDDFARCVLDELSRHNRTARHHHNTTDNVALSGFVYFSVAIG